MQAVIQCCCPSPLEHPEATCHGCASIHCLQHSTHCLHKAQGRGRAELLFCSEFLLLELVLHLNWGEAASRAHVLGAAGLEPSSLGLEVVSGLGCCPVGATNLLVPPVGLAEWRVWAGCLLWLLVCVLVLCTGAGSSAIGAAGEGAEELICPSAVPVLDIRTWGSWKPLLGQRGEGLQPLGEFWFPEQFL